MGLVDGFGIGRSRVCVSQLDSKLVNLLSISRVLEIVSGSKVNMSLLNG